MQSKLYFWHKTLIRTIVICIVTSENNIQALKENFYIWIKGLFTWSGGPRSSGVGFFCFHALEDTKQKKLTPLDRGPPLHVNRVLISRNDNVVSFHPAMPRE